MKELCSIVVVLSSHHRNLLHLVEIQPPSVLGVQLQRLLSATLLQWLVPKFCEHVDAEKNRTSERCDAPVPDSIEVITVRAATEMQGRCFRVSKINIASLHSVCLPIVVVSVWYSVLKITVGHWTYSDQILKMSGQVRVMIGHDDRTSHQHMLSYHLQGVVSQ